MEKFEKTVTITLSEYDMLRKLYESYDTILNDNGYVEAVKTFTMYQGSSLYIRVEKVQLHEELLKQMNILNIEFEAYKKQYSAPLTSQPYNPKWKVLLDKLGLK